MFQWNSPNFYALYPCGVSYPSILGELLGAATGGVCFSWVGCLTKLNDCKNKSKYKKEKKYCQSNACDWIIKFISA